MEMQPDPIRINAFHKGNESVDLLRRGPHVIRDREPAVHKAFAFDQFLFRHGALDVDDHFVDRGIVFSGASPDYAAGHRAHALGFVFLDLFMRHPRVGPVVNPVHGERDSPVDKEMALLPQIEDEYGPVSGIFPQGRGKIPELRDRKLRYPKYTAYPDLFPRA